MKKSTLMILIAIASVAGYANTASALCKEYPTKAENRNGVIGEALNDRGVDAIGASGEHPCRGQKEIPSKTPHKKKADANAKQNSTAPAPTQQKPAEQK